MRAIIFATAAFVLLIAACTDDTDAAAVGIPDSSIDESDSLVPVDPSEPSPPFVFGPLPVGEEVDFGSPPPVPDSPLTAAQLDAIETFFGPSLGDGVFLAEEWEALATLGSSGDPRLGWLFSDMLRISTGGDLTARLNRASQELLGLQVDELNPWGDVTNHLIAWDVPAPPDYLRVKRDIYTLIEPGWEPLFADDSDVDWRLISWGGVRIDDRPFGTTDEECNCIPAADNPDFVAAGDTAWPADDAVVFGVEINGESRAYPRQIMEVREMVNDTLGERDIAMPYCTLCGSAQVYFTDELPDGIDRPVLRTSGLLTRSNKVMYDLITFSMIDTFTGEAKTGPLAEQGIVLEQAGVVTTTWGDWKADHPDSTVLVEELALARDFDFRNNRDADGPIFPIGDVDPRLPVQEDVIGVITESGTPVAFHLTSALAALRAGEELGVENIQLVLDGGGVRAVDSDGNDAGGHQAFWFAWSQFYPETLLMP